MKRKHKGFRMLSFLVIATLVTGLLASCSSTNKKEEKQQATNEKKTIKIFIPGYEDELFKGLYDSGINGFKKENPNVDVQVVPAGWEEANSKLISLIQANESPDVIITGSRSLRQFAELGAIEKLDNYITEDFKKERVENVLKTANIKGVQYGIPLAFSSRALYYRTDLIKTPPKTWDELYSTAEKVKKEKSDMYGFAVPTDMASGTDEIFNFIYQNGGSATDKDGNIKLATTENIKTLEFLKKFNDAKLIPDPVATKRSDQAQMFQNGKLAMFISGPWEKKKVEAGKEKAPYGVAVLPAGASKAETLVTDSFSISSASKNKDIAWKLINYMGKFEYQNAYDEAIGFFPILKAEEKEERYNNEFLKPFKEMIQYGIGEPQVPVWDTFNKEFVTAVQKVMTGKTGAKEALESAEKELTTK
ncbi:sugar ABC transporter substrate-binding protein [Clostridium cylindrosporum]|uniref:Maltose-binding periplasmic protein n=1 Tax=Clostridium cylindrosporum DSM 605 TaxID=1121307 RepID=A0A0J8D7W3_CLOCY|nr:sugar ABC transporter substrate-binding protein [Clostridium cylindrosporum]KMT22135.1 maltose-binding periplasmic protein [Clostridium cylindrosporum DSM 605]